MGAEVGVRIKVLELSVLLYFPFSVHPLLHARTGVADSHVRVFAFSTIVPRTVHYVKTDQRLSAVALN